MVFFRAMRPHIFKGSLYGFVTFGIAFIATSVLAWGDLLIYNRVDISGVPQELGVVFFGDLFINPGGYTRGLLLPVTIYRLLPLIFLILVVGWFVVQKSRAGDHVDIDQEHQRKQNIGIGLALVPGYILGYLLLHTVMVLRAPDFVLNLFGLWLSEFPFMWGVAMPAIAGVVGGYLAS